MNQRNDGSVSILACIEREERIVPLKILDYFMTYEINETHDPNLNSWIESANDPNTDFPIQNLPVRTISGRERSGRDRRRYRRPDFRSLRCAASWAFSTTCSGAGRRSDCTMGSICPTFSEWTPAGIVGGSPSSKPDTPERCKFLYAGAVAQCLTADFAGKYRHALRDRRLHRLLLLDLSRDECRLDVSARQSAAAELQICADRLSRAGFVHRASGTRFNGRTGKPVRRRKAAGVISRAKISITRWRSASLSGRGMSLASRSRSARRRSISSACASSTTGRRATSRRGNTSRSDRFSQRILPRRSRRLS